MKPSHLLRNIDIIFCLIILPAMIIIFPVERWAQNFPLYSILVGIWLYLLYFINRRFVAPMMIRTGSKDIISKGVVMRGSDIILPIGRTFIKTYRF